MVDNAAARAGIVALAWRFVRPYWWQIIVVVDLLVFQAVESLILPDLYANIINNGVLRGDTSYIWLTGTVMLGIIVLIGITAVVAAYWAARLAIWVTADIRAEIYRRVRAFSAQEVNHFGIPSLITRNTNDTEQIGVFVTMMLTALVPAIVTCIGG